MFADSSQWFASVASKQCDIIKCSSFHVKPLNAVYTLIQLTLSVRSVRCYFPCIQLNFVTRKDNRGKCKFIISIRDTKIHCLSNKHYRRPRTTTLTKCFSNSLHRISVFAHHFAVVFVPAFILFGCLINILEVNKKCCF